MEASGKNSQKGYDKRPIWFWILIYLVVAAVVYGIVYMVVTSGDSGLNY